MIIKNTDATYCKIKDIKVSGLDAYITLLIYSSKPQTTEDNLGRITRVFSFFLKDKDTGNITRLNNNNYWIDRCNNYNNDSTNIDINMYKEIILTIDISNLNTSKMLGNTWIRECSLLILDQQSSSNNILWESEELQLISKEIITPSISNIRISTTSNSSLIISFNETFESQEDFNYSNNNLITEVNILSAYNNHLIEKHKVLESELQNTLVTLKTFEHKFDSPIIIQINVLNNIGEILLQETKFYNPLNIHKVFIKQGNSIRQINTCTINNKQVLNINKK